LLIQQKLNIERFENENNALIPPDESIEYSAFRPCDLKNANSCTTTSKELQNNSTDFVQTYSQYEDNYSYYNVTLGTNDYTKYFDIQSKESLLAYRCLLMSPKALALNLQNNKINSDTFKYAFDYRKIYIHNYKYLEEYIFNIIESYFNNNINKTKQSGSTQSTGTNKIVGPIYVCLSQSPYIKIDKDMLVARGDVIENKKSYYIEDNIKGITVVNKEPTNQNGEFSSLYAEVLIIFANYEMYLDKTTSKKILSFTGKSRQFLNELQSYFTSDKLCYLKCNKTDLNCGCLNAKKDQMESDIMSGRAYIHDEYKIPLEKDSKMFKSIKAYNSKCVNNKDIETDYSIMYYINPYSAFNVFVTNFTRNKEIKRPSPM
jgi:hypothetical protein